MKENGKYATLWRKLQSFHVMTFGKTLQEKIEMSVYDNVMLNTR